MENNPNNLRLATERQRNFLDRAGIIYAKDISLAEASKLIGDEIVKREQRSSDRNLREGLRRSCGRGARDFL
jgi:hypothetical protein